MLSQKRKELVKRQAINSFFLLTDLLCGVIIGHHGKEKSTKNSYPSTKMARKIMKKSMWKDILGDLCESLPEICHALGFKYYDSTNEWEFVQGEQDQDHNLLIGSVIITLPNSRSLTWKEIWKKAISSLSDSILELYRNEYDRHRRYSENQSSRSEVLANAKAFSVDRKSIENIQMKVTQPTSKENLEKYLTHLRSELKIAQKLLKEIKK